MDQELTSAKTALETDLAEQQQEAADLATENERQAADIEDKNETVIKLQAELATLQGRIGQREVDFTTAKNNADREREAAETSRIELAKSLLRLEAIPRMETDLAALRVELDKERSGRISAEQQTAVLTAKLEAASDRTSRAEATAIEATRRARKSDEALSLEVSKVESALNSIANLNGKLETMQVQVQQQTQELGTARQEAKKAIEEAAELRGKHAGNTELKSSET